MSTEEALEERIRDIMEQAPEHEVLERLVRLVEDERKEIAEQTRWCAFCGDEMECFGCQPMQPERSTENHIKIHLKNEQAVFED